MKTIALGLCLLLVQTPTAQQNSATIQGVVTKLGTGDPLARARVVLTRDGAGPTSIGPLTTVTGGDGKFTLQNIPAGNYRLFVTHDGFVRNEYGQTKAGRPGTVITLAPKQEWKDIGIAMTPTGAIGGRVFDRYGEPLSNANVQAMKYSYVEGKRMLTVAQAARTNDLGEYRLFYLLPGPYIVSALPSEIRSDGAGYVIDVVPGSPIQLNGGTAGATVRIGGNVGLTGLTSGLVSPAETGETYLPVYYPGVTDAAAAAPIILQAAANLIGVDFVAADVRAVRIRGTISGATNPTVTLMPRGTLLPGTSPLRNAAVSNGTFEFRGIPPGSYDLAAYANLTSVSRAAPAPSITRVGARMQLEVGNADIDNLSLVLQSGFTVTGAIVVDGVGTDPRDARTIFMGMGVQLRPEVVSTMLQPISSMGTDGTFSMTSVFTGDYRLSVVNPPKNSYVKSARFAGMDVLNFGLHIDGEPRATLDIVIGQNPGSVDAIVMDERAKPAGGVTVVLVPNAPSRQRYDIYKTATTDSSGRIHLDAVAPGDYKAFAWEDVENGAWQDPEFLSKFEDRGKPLHITEGAKENLELRLIPR